MRRAAHAMFRPVLLWLLLLLGPAPAFAIDAGMPNPPASPTVVKVGIFLADIIDLDEMDETFQAELIILAEWMDPRLAFDAEEYGSDRKLFQGGFQFDEVFGGWWPSLIFLNEIGSGDLNALQIEVFSDGRVRAKEQRNVTLETPMKLHSFPFDSQVLEADMIAFGDTSREVVLEVHQGMLGASEEYAETNQRVNIAQWQLVNVDMTPFISKTRYYAEDAEVSGVKLAITLKRNPMNIIWKVLAPMVILVSLMWAVFWMDIHDLSDRLNVSFIGILTIVAYQFLIDGTMPRISYFTLTDTVVLYSFVIMCLTILESLVVVSLSRADQDTVARRVDATAQWLFPVVYFSGLVVIFAAYYFLIGI
ncbi:ligand-gated ion channel [Methyloceanibacter sp. wino2]|uniref:ligand-gated ion channel n=1 Tax=Methyloceanibacter sp. wino2 TaxID=2170729 RepID=UPI000D3E4853|nr:ligand-gated ion channel [Methyloceanibacter sp. wino2]